MKKLTLKSLLVIAVMLLGATSTWAAGYTRTLNDSYGVTGYKFKAFYDFQNNNPEVLPTSGDLRYREGGIWGLHNFGSGERSATVSIPVNKGDLLVLQVYAASTFKSITPGSKNTTLSGTYECFDITADATSINITTYRYGGVVAALVLEVDENASTADYTINYKNGENTVKSTTGNAAVGTVIPVESSFTLEGVKYITNSGQPTSLTVAASGNTLNIAVSAAQEFSYTVNATDGTNTLKQLATGKTYQGESVTIAYPKYINVNGSLVTKNAISSQYRENVVVSANNQVTSFVYSATDIDNIVYFSEAEEIDGAISTSEGSNMLVRSSNAACGYIDQDVTLINLEPGIYKATMVCYSNSSAGATQSFKFGDTDFDATISGASNWSGFEKEFTLYSAADIQWINSNSGNKNGLDYIYIQKIGDIYGIVGELTGGWDNDMVMTQDSENENLYTLEVPGFQAEAGTTYKYKLRDNYDWDGYTLPNSGDYEWICPETGEYNLTFIANIGGDQIGDYAGYTVTLKAELVTYDFSVTFVNDAGWEQVYAYAWNGDGNSAVQLAGDWPGTQLETTGTTTIGGSEYDVYTYTYNGVSAPEKIIFNNGNNGQQTADLIFETGKQYKYTLTATITSAGYASFSCAQAVQIPEGVTAYYAVAKDAENVTLKEITNGTIAAEEGVVLAGEAATYTLAPATESVSKIEGNLLKPWLTDGTPSESVYYTLAAGPSFKKSTGGVLAAGKAYLVMPNNNNAPQVNIIFDGTATGIQSVSNVNANNRIYNLQGQRVSQPQKGLYIIDGKKVVLK